MDPDFEDKVAVATVWYDFKNTEPAKCAKLTYYDVVSCEEHRRIYTRIFFDEIQELVVDESLQFNNMNFSISPIKGNLWPHKVNELTVSFHPKEIGEFETVAYLDMDGVSDRVPIKIMGTSLPPKIVLSFETLDMDRVYINKTYQYEITATNQGHINGVLVYKEMPTLFDSKIACTPESACLRPLEKQVFIISFMKSNQGPFFEEINFSIRDTKVVLRVYLRGTVIYPSLMFNIPCVDFGNVSIGVPKVMEFYVINESDVNVRGSVKIPTDGPEIDSVKLEDCLVNDAMLVEIPKWPKEFYIEPRIVEIDPQSKLSLKITLIANLIRANQTTLELELEKSDSPPVTLPVSYNAMVPVITPAPDINIRVCFIDYPYYENVTITAHDYYGYFVLEEVEDETVFEIETELKRGLIYPNSIITFPIKITMKQLGTYSFSLRMHLFALSSPIEICHIAGTCVRPILTCSPVSLHWGTVKLLVRTQKTLTIVNDSPCYVNYKTSLLHDKGMWSVTPSEGVINPEEEVELVVSLCLSDADYYTNKIILQFEKVKDIIVPISATGAGTSITVGELRDRIELGNHFTRHPMRCKVLIRNCGTRFHSLEWSEFIKPPKTKTIPTPFFTIEPKVFKIGKGETTEMFISAFSTKMLTAREIWYLIGSVEGVNKKEVLMECPIEANFVDPKIEVSSNLMMFISDTGPYNEYYKITDILTIKNVSKLPLDIELKLRNPFLIIQKHDTYKILPQEDVTCHCIYYDECDLNLDNIKNNSESGKPPIYIDFVTMKPVPPLREGSLQFFEDINKIKMAFNVTQSIEERLEDEDIMKLQVVFDSSKHTSLRSRTYTDLVRIKFKGLKNKDAVKLVAKISFPNVTVLTPKIDFTCIKNGTLQCQCIRIQNVTTVRVCYRFRWRKFCVTNVPVLADDDEEDAMLQSTSQESTLTDATMLDESTVENETVTENSPLGEEGLKEEIKPEELKHPSKHHMSHIESQICEDIPLVDELELVKKKTINLLAPMINHKSQNSERIWSEKLPKLTKYTTEDINDIFILSPHRGYLRSDEVQSIHVIFRPRCDISVKATLECEVLGGPSEFITISAMSSNLKYKLSTTRLNFKIRPFFENASESLRLKNIAMLSFEIQVFLNEPQMDTELEGLLYDIIPSVTKLLPEQESEIVVNTRPGVMGFFNRQFILEIGYLPHLTIDVIGWGVIPQVYIPLPKVASPDFQIRCIPEVDPFICYRAIATLTKEYIIAISEIFLNPIPDILNSPLLDTPIKDKIFDDEWHICSASDGFPKRMDVDMATEREKVVEHLKRHPNVIKEFRAGTTQGPIPDFYTFLYIIDFGVVITGNSFCQKIQPHLWLQNGIESKGSPFYVKVHSSVNVVNYGPTATKLHLGRNSVIPSWLSLKICGKINPGDSGKIEVSFSPTPEEFPLLEQTVETNFFLEVPFGVTIPIQVKAICAVPYLKTSVSLIDFGSVKCGDKMIKSIPLRNTCKPVCIWHAVLKLFTPGPNPMVLFDNSGKFDPGEGDWLKIAFKPVMEMKYEGVLIFKFHMNPYKMTIPVTGQGMMPQVLPIGPHQQFPPTLPYSQPTELYFGFTNPCTFPIELIMFHADELWPAEMTIYHFLQKYYNGPEEMIVPTIHPGETWPTPVVQCYERFQQTVKRLLLEGHLSKNEKDKAKKAAPKGTKLTSNTQLHTKPRTQAEIEATVIEKMKAEGIDPLFECKEVYNFDIVPKKPKKPRGLIVFMHGSPCEEILCVETAYALGKALCLPVINIDTCFAQALSKCTSLERDTLMSTIDEFYENMQSLFLVNMNESLLEFLAPGENQYSEDAIKAKVKFFMCNQGNATPRSKASEKRKPAASGTTSAVKGSTTAMFELELLEELFTEYFNLPKFKRGFIVETLTSDLFRSPPLVLTTILKCNKKIVNVHMVLCQSDYAKWLQAYEEKLEETDEIEQKEAEEYSEDKIEEIIKICENMDADEFENAPEEYKTVFINHGLKLRRQKFLQRNAARTETAGASNAKTAFKKPTDSKSVTKTVSLADTKKKSAKKEEVKGKPTSPIYGIMSNKYADYYKNVHDHIISVAVNWSFEEADLATPLVNLSGQPIGVQVKKAGKKKDAPEEDEIDYENRGFPLTFITCPCTRYKEGLIDMFLKSATVQTALRKESVPNVLESPIRDEAYTVLLPISTPQLVFEKALDFMFLEEEPIKKCECSQFTDLNYLDDSTQENIVNILSKWYCMCGKKLTSVQTSTIEVPVKSSKDSQEKGSQDKNSKGSQEKSSKGPSKKIALDKSSSQDRSTNDDNEFYFQPLPLTSVPASTSYKKRIVLEPGDLTRCKYVFKPTVEGTYSFKRYVEVRGWPNSKVELSVSAICDIPRLDNRPKKMFANFTRKTVEDKIYKTTFLDDQGVFEFGHIFIGQNRVYEEGYTIKLKNSSLMTAEIDSEFEVDNDIFRVDKNSLTIEPGCKDVIDIFAAPTVVGVHTCTLLLCIKDNPEIVIINITCTGVVPILEVLPESKIIDYGKHLLYRRAHDRFIIKNNSILPVMWKINNPEDFVEDFLMTELTGVIPRYDNRVIHVTYIACNVGVIFNKPLTIDVYDERGRGEPMFTDRLFFSAECYDVMVVCAYENPNENLLNFGNVKVNSSAYREMYLFNRGPYDVYYKLKKVKKFPDQCLLKSMEASNETGLIPAKSKPAGIGFQCTPVQAIKFNNEPIYMCSIIDGTKDQVVVAKFPICISILSYYNTFTLFPVGELNFHIIPVGTSVVKQVILTNTSVGPFTYEITLPEKYQGIEYSLPIKTDKKDSKISRPPLVCGTFLILNEDNLLEFGSARIISIQFTATESRTFEETIRFVVSDTSPEHAQGVPLRLVGTGSLPKLDFWNIETTFKEHIIVKHLSDYHVSEASPHCVFVEDSVTLRFFCVTVGTKHTAGIHLYNDGLVPSIITMSIQYQNPSDRDVFWLNKYDAQVEALLYKQLGITFQPKALKEYRAVLEITLRISSTQHITYKLCIVGEGVIPRIHLCTPTVKQNKLAFINFPVTCLGSVSKQIMKFENISSVKSQVLLQISQPSYDTRPVFWLNTANNCDHMVMEKKSDTATSIKLLVNPEEIATVAIYYNPLNKGRICCDVKISVKDNPFEYFTVLCEAVAFMEDVILLGLEMLPMDTDLDSYRAASGSASTSSDRKKSKSAPVDKKKKPPDQKKYKKTQSRSSIKGSDTLSEEPVELKYILDFGGCELCTMQKRSVIMVNNSEKVYKFTWTQPNNIIIKPSVGFISPGEEKDLEISFFSPEPLTLRRELFDCSLIAISDESLITQGQTWDNRQTLTQLEYLESKNSIHENSQERETTTCSAPMSLEKYRQETQGIALQRKLNLI